MEVIIGFLVGVASSSIVAFIVYRRQKKESLKTELGLLNQLSNVLSTTRVAAATSLMAAGSTERIERDIAILRRQISQSLNKDETVQDQHFDQVKKILGISVHIDEAQLKTLHASLIGEESDYGGQFRDLPIKIIGANREYSAPAADMVPSLIVNLLSRWNADIDNRTETEEINYAAQFHVQLLRIHPFFDGNGLLARVLLTMQLEKFTGKRLLINRGDNEYLSALESCTDDDITPLLHLIITRLDAISPN